MEKFVPKVSEINEAKFRPAKVKSEKEKYFDRERLGKTKMTQTKLSLANEIRKVMDKWGNRPNVSEMLDEIFNILNNSELHIAEQTRNYWINKFLEIPPIPRSKDRLMRTMTNIMMKGDGLGLN